MAMFKVLILQAQDTVSDDSELPWPEAAKTRRTMEYLMRDRLSWLLYLGFDLGRATDRITGQMYLKTPHPLDLPSTVWKLRLDQPSIANNAMVSKRVSTQSEARYSPPTACTRDTSDPCYSVPGDKHRWKFAAPSPASATGRQPGTRRSGS